LANVSSFVEPKQMRFPRLASKSVDQPLDS
jgi:hypothetical protein